MHHTRTPSLQLKPYLNNKCFVHVPPRKNPVLLVYGTTPRRPCQVSIQSGLHPVPIAALHAAWVQGWVGEGRGWGGGGGGGCKNMVTRIYTPCVFDIPVPKRLTFCHFFSDQFLHQTTKSFKSLSFHLACGRRISLRHVVAIDPLIAQNLALMVGPVRFFIWLGQNFWGGSNKD